VILKEPVLLTGVETPSIVLVAPTTLPATFKMELSSLVMAIVESFLVFTLLMVLL